MSWLAMLWRFRFCFKVVSATCLFLAMTAFETFPLLLHLSTHIPSQPGDPLLNTWILAWDFHALTTQPWNLFNANIFYPASNTLALSEHMLGVLPIFALTYALTGNPILSYNVIFFLAFTLSGVTMFLLVYHWTQHFWAALIAGFLFAFAPIRILHFGHVQLLNLFWAPLAFLYLEKFLRKNTWNNLAWFSIFYSMQVLSSVYLGWFTTIAVVVYVSYNVLYVDRTLLKREMVSRYIAFSFFCFFIIVPFHLPYYKLKYQWRISSPIQQSIYYSSDLLLSYITVPDFMNDLHFSIFQRGSQSGLYEQLLFPGIFVTVMIILVCVTKYYPSRHAHFQYMSRIYLTVMFSSFILSLGPYLIILGWNTHLPLPYLLLYYLIPGFQAMRVPARFGFMMMLAASVLASLGFLKFCQLLSLHPRIRKLPEPAWQGVLALLCLALITSELGFKPTQLTRIPVGREVPEVYRWLAAQSPGPLIELPTGMWENFMYEYFSTYHWFPIINGSSGYAPPTYGQILRELQLFPTHDGVTFLGAIGVKWVVVHFGQLQPHEALLWRLAPLADWGVEKVAEFGSDVVYKIPPADVTEELRIGLAALDQLPSNTKVHLGLHARSVDHRTWTFREPLGRVVVFVEWVQQGTGKRLVTQEFLETPLVIASERVMPLELSVQTPALPGHYRLTVQIPAFNIKTDPWQVELTSEPFPTSLHNPQLLSAKYSWEGQQVPAIIDQPFPIEVGALNNGRATWLARTEDGTGTVRLGWRWHKGDQIISHAGGRELLKHDVFPGGEAIFRMRIPLPTESGEYILELGLVSEVVAWFFQVGVEPVKVAVRVASPRRDHFERSLAMPMEPIDNPPQIAVSTDRPRYQRGDRLHVLVNVGTPERTHTVDAYLALVSPDGHLSFRDHNGSLMASEGAWIPWAKNTVLATGTQLTNHPLMDLNLVDMPHGSYICYLILTEPNTYQIITKAETLFTIEP